MTPDKHFKSIDKLARERPKQLGDENAFAQLIFQSSPLGAWLVLVSALAVAMFLGNAMLSNDPIRGQQIGGVVIYLGWFAFFYRIHEPYAPGRSNLRHLIAAGYVVTVAVHIGFSILFPTGSANGASSAILATSLWGIGFVVPLLIMVGSARLLVRMESAERTRLDQVVGTFFAMFFLPVGIFLLQRRILQLRNGGRSSAQPNERSERSSEL